MTADPALASTLTQRAEPATASWTVSNARLLSAIHPVAAQRSVTERATTARPTRYTVRSGDSLSKIAQNVYHDPDAWPALYWSNRGRIHWADSVDAGQVLTIPVKPARIPTAPSQLAPAPVLEQASAQQADSAQPAAAATPEPAQSAGTSTGSSSFQECVIARESGGNSQVMNSTGHYGLYQFSAGTWAAYGGNPADFGDASVAEQNAVFDNAIAAGGQSNWSAYDGC